MIDNNRNTKHYRPSNNKPNYGSQERKKQGIRGHDAALHHFQRSKEPVAIMLTAPFPLNHDLALKPKTTLMLIGVLTQYDAYTITIENEQFKSPLILFKSNILGLTKYHAD